MSLLKQPQVSTTSVTAPKRPLVVKLLVAMSALLAFLSIPPGVELLTDPTGAPLGIQSVLPSHSNP